MERLFDCDPGKGQGSSPIATWLREMGVVFHDPARLDLVDARFDYGEERRVTIGRAGGYGLYGGVYDARIRDLADHRLGRQPQERERYGRD